MNEKEELEMLKFYLEESDDAKLDTTPVPIDGSLCIKCRWNLTEYCIKKNMNVPYKNYCDEYCLKVLEKKKRRMTNIIRIP